MYPVKKILTKDFLKQDIDQLTYNPDSLDSLHSKAEKYVKDKQWLTCLEVLDKIQALFGETSQLYLNKALCLYRLGDIRDGTLCLEESLKVDLSNEATLIMLGKLKDRLKSMRDYTMSVYG